MARKGSFRVEVSHELSDWMTALDGAGRPQPEAVAAWTAGVEVFFGATQDVVHVVSGDLKRSGHASVAVVGPEMVGTVEYDAEYAMDEILRGGDHDFMQRGFEQVQGVFESALLTAVAAQFNGGR